MSDRLSVFDRLRIERVVWALDQQIYELPRARRIATRREVRANLTEAARELGTTAALRNLGTSSQLAEEYLQAQFGTGPRPSWLAAALFALTTTLVLTSFLADAETAFARGVLAVDPQASGVHTWSGVTPLQQEATFTFHNGAWQSVGGAFTPLTYVLLLVGAVLVGRLWRALPKRRAGEAAPSPA